MVQMQWSCLVGRELAVQIAEQFEALGATIGLKTAVVVGGIDMMTQASPQCPFAFIHQGID